MAELACWAQLYAEDCDISFKTRQIQDKDYSNRICLARLPKLSYSGLKKRYSARQKRQPILKQSARRRSGNHSIRCDQTRGVILGSSLSRTSFAKTTGECEEKCTGLDSCVAFTFNKAPQSCYLYNRLPNFTPAQGSELQAYAKRYQLVHALYLNLTVMMYRRCYRKARRLLVVSYRRDIKSDRRFNIVSNWNRFCCNSAFLVFFFSHKRFPSCRQKHQLQPAERSRKRPYTYRDHF